MQNLSITKGRCGKTATILKIKKPANSTFPAAEAVSIIEVIRFHFSVRNGKRWFTHNLITG